MRKGGIGGRRRWWSGLMAPLRNCVHAKCMAFPSSLSHSLPWAVSPCIPLLRDWAARRRRLKVCCQEGTNGVQLKKKKKAHLSQHLHPSLPFYILHQHSLALSSLLIYIFILLDNCISSDYTIINIHGANSQTLCSHRPVIKPGHSNVSLTNC